jgi:hypothetical protein
MTKEFLGSGNAFSWASINGKFHAELEYRADVATGGLLRFECLKRFGVGKNGFIYMSFGQACLLPVLEERHRNVLHRLSP